MSDQILNNYLPVAPDWNLLNATAVNEPPRLELVDGFPSVVLSTTDGDLTIMLSRNFIRIFNDQLRSNEYALIQRLPDNDLSLVKIQVSHRGADCWSFECVDYVLIVCLEPLSLSVEKLADGEQRTIFSSATDGHFVRRHRVPPFARTEQGWLMSIHLASGDRVYGLGEKWGRLNKRGELIRSYNSDALGVNAEVSYKNIPFAWCPTGWGAFAHTPSPVTHAVGHCAWSQRSYCMLIEDQALDVFISLSNPTENVAAQQIEIHTSLTGRAPMPPNWAGGVILSKAYYKTADEILEVAREVRKRAMPCDVITFDGRAWQNTQTRFSFEWDQTRYPDPKLVIDELKGMGFKLCIWEYPLISIENPWFKKFEERGWLLKDSRTGRAYEYEWDQQAFGEVLTALPISGLVDFTQPDAYAFWRDAHKSLFEFGIDMIKADFGEQIESNYILASNGETGHGLHNVYAHLYNRCVFEAAEKYSQSGAFLFSRAAWIGCQRFNSQWGGDPQADWEGMMGNIRGGLSWGLTGAPFYATDVGGFYKDTRDDVLYVRWAQAAVFSAHYRLHGIGPREPWSYSDAANSAVLQALQLRYRLQYYLQRAMLQATQTGLPVQRPMVLAFPENKESWAFENQFMFGDQILVAPCFDPSGLVEVYLPSGDWVQFDLQSDQHARFEGGKLHVVRLELNQIAAFVRAGQSIPLNAPVLQTHDLKTDHQGLFVIDEFWTA